MLNAPARSGVRMQTVTNEDIVAAIELGRGYPVGQGADVARRLGHLRTMYEPFVEGLSAALAIELPPWVRDGAARDNWEATPKVQRDAHL